MRANKYRPWRGCGPALLLAGLMTLAGAAQAAAPSFDCGKVEAGSVEGLVCQNAELAAADRKLAAVYGAAVAKAHHEHPPALKAEQRGWIRGRNECWKSEDRRACVADAYRLRTAELQARHRLLPPTGTARYICDGQWANEVTATFFATDPPTAIAERGEQVSLMYQRPSGSGARYQDRNESLWENQGEVLIAWGSGSQEMRCQIKP